MKDYCRVVFLLDGVAYNFYSTSLRVKIFNIIDMNLYEFEGKEMFSKFGITVPKSVLLRREDDVVEKYRSGGGPASPI